MAVVITSTTSSGVAARMLTYLSKKLQYVQTDNLVLDQFGITEELPTEQGVKTITFFKPEKASATLYSATTDNAIAALNLLTEGTAPTTFRENVWTNVVCTLKQFGQVTKISDLMSSLDAYKPIKQNIELMGRDAALHYDTVIRNSLVGATHPSGTGTPLTHDSQVAGNYGAEIFAAAAGTWTATSSGSGTSTALFNALKLLTQANSKLTRLGALSAVTRLKTKKAPTLKNGNYVCVVPPQCVHDLVQDSSYSNAFQGRGATGIYKREVGTVDGCTFVEATNPFIEDETYETYSSTDTVNAGLVYTSLFLGAGAYGVPKLAGSKSPLAPRIIIVDKADSGNPLQQYILAGWKGFYMSQGLDTDNIVALRSKSTFA